MGCGGGWIIDVYVVDCGGDWGWWFLLLLALSALGYVGGSVAVNHKSRGMPLDRTALPHPVRAQQPPDASCLLYLDRRLVQNLLRTSALSVVQPLV